MLPVYFYTFGCKLNQLETESAADAFSKAGFTVTEWNPRVKAGEGSLFVINTCTVTGKA